jgi:hypothetical protein
MNHLEEKNLYVPSSDEISEKAFFMKLCPPSILVEEWNKVSSNWDPESVIKIYKLIGQKVVLKMIDEVSKRD